MAATGVYTYNEVPMYFHFRGPGALLGGPEPMTELFVREIQRGHRGYRRAGGNPQVRH